MWNHTQNSEPYDVTGSAYAEQREKFNVLQREREHPRNWLERKEITWEVLLTPNHDGARTIRGTWIQHEERVEAGYEHVYTNKEVNYVFKRSEMTTYLYMKR